MHIVSAQKKTILINVIIIMGRRMVSSISWLFEIIWENGLTVSGLCVVGPYILSFSSLSLKSFLQNLVTKYGKTMNWGNHKENFKPTKEQSRTSKSFWYPLFKRKNQESVVTFIRMVLPVTDYLKLEKSLDFLSLLLSCKTGEIICSYH